MRGWLRNLSVSPLTAPMVALVVAALPAAGLLPGFAVDAPRHTGGPQDQPAARQQALTELGDDINEILADPRLDGAQAGVVVRNATSGTYLYKRNPRRRLMPASNNKLLTSAAAMEVLGPGYRFETTVAADGRRRGPILLGDLYLEGTGDPTMLASDYDKLADKVADRGIRLVRGDLVADDTWFDDVRLGRDWAWSDEQYYYAAPISALSVAPNKDYDAGTVIVEVRPGAAPGEPARVELRPHTDYVTVVNRATTGKPGNDRDISINRAHGTNTITVSGSVPVDGEADSTWRSVWKPTAYAADIFRQALRDHGVRVLGDTAFRAAPETARRLARHESMPLSELLIPFMKLSNNGHAEVLTKAMGREVHKEGSWDAGLDVISDYLNEAGLDTETLRMVDGSGLSRMNLVPPKQLSILLLDVQDEEWYPAWYEALPIAGKEKRFVGGTLRDRMTGTAAAGNVHAKTGTLTGATALSGYITDADGKKLIFSIVFNDHLSSAPKDLEDDIAVTLAEFSRDATAQREQQRTQRRDATGESTDAGRTPPAVRDDPSTRVDESSLECSWTKSC